MQSFGVRRINRHAATLAQVGLCASFVVITIGAVESTPTSAPPNSQNAMTPAPLSEIRCQASWDRLYNMFSKLGSSYFHCDYNTMTCERGMAMPGNSKSGCLSCWQRIAKP